MGFPFKEKLHWKEKLLWLKLRGTLFYAYQHKYLEEYLTSPLKKRSSFTSVFHELLSHWPFTRFPVLGLTCLIQSQPQIHQKAIDYSIIVMQILNHSISLWELYCSMQGLKLGKSIADFCPLVTGIATSRTMKAN